VALREAHAIGAHVVLGDRSLAVTLARVWHALSLWEKFKLTGTLLWTGLRCVPRAAVVIFLGGVRGRWGGARVWRGRLVHLPGR
jgi:pheromone shutdown protein TraB